MKASAIVEIVEILSQEFARKLFSQQTCLKLDFLIPFFQKEQWVGKIPNANEVEKI